MTPVATESIKVERPTRERLQELEIEKWSSWECGPEAFDWEYTSREMAYVFEGRVKVTTADGLEAEIKAGDLVTFPKGLKCRWNVIEKIRKVYSFR